MSMLSEILQTIFGSEKRKLSKYALSKIASIREVYQRNPHAITNLLVREAGEEVWYLLSTRREAEVLLQSIESFQIELIE